jgi:hypothetical protein
MSSGNERASRPRSGTALTTSRSEAFPLFPAPQRRARGSLNLD